MEVKQETMEEKEMISFNDMWALDNILTIDLGCLDKDNQKKLRSNILNPIFTDIIIEIFNESTKGDIYKLVCKPDGFELYRNTNGTYGAVYRKNGKIVEHTQWEKERIDFSNIVKNLANVAINMYIANKVTEIEDITKKILEGQYLNRLSDIKGAIKSYFVLNDEDKKRMSMMKGNILQLITGIDKLESQLFDQELKDLNPESTIADNWFKHDKNKCNNDKFNKINFIINYIIFAYRILIKWDFDCNNTNQEGVKMFNDFIERMNKDNMWEKICTFAEGTLPLKKGKNELYFRGEDYKKINEIVKINNKKDDLVKIEYKQVEFIIEQ